LHELIAALDRCVPHVGRAGEIAIAREGIALRDKALQRIAEVESEPRNKSDRSRVAIPGENEDGAKRQLARRLGF
jgi:hypothetical protein